MAKRRHPVLVATRVTKGERAIIDAAASICGMPVSQMVREIVLPEVSRRVQATAAEVARG